MIFFFFFFYPYFFTTFCGRTLESMFICSLVLVQPRKAYLDITDWNQRIKINKVVSYLIDSWFNGGQNFSRFRIDSQIITHVGQ